MSITTCIGCDGNRRSSAPNRLDALLAIEPVRGSAGVSVNEATMAWDQQVAAAPAAMQLDVLEKLFLVKVPSPTTTAMMTAAMAPRRSPYSTAVAPWSAARVVLCLLMSFLCLLTQGEVWGRVNGPLRVVA
jgi:hypothetical protein